MPSKPWNQLKLRIRTLLRSQKKVPEEVTPYLTFKGYQLILKKALKALTSNHPSAIHLKKEDKRDTDDRTAEIVLLEDEYQLFLNPNYKLADGKLDPEGIIAKGSNKTILPAVRLDKRSPSPYIVAKLFNTLESDSMSEIKKELKLKDTLQHKALLPYSKGCVYQNKNKHKATLYAPRADCTLEEWLDKNPDAHYRVRLQILIDIIQALSYLHQRNIVHNDMASFNIVMFKNKPRIIDFERAKKISDQEDLEHKIAKDIDEFVIIAYDVLYLTCPNSEEKKIEPNYRIDLLDKIKNHLYRATTDEVLKALNDTYLTWEKLHLLENTPSPLKSPAQRAAKGHD